MEKRVAMSRSAADNGVPSGRRAWLRRASSGLGRAVAGNASIEFGFLIAMLAALAIGTFDFGRMGLQKIAVTNAARAGTQYGAQDLGTAVDPAGMVQAARNDIGDTTNAVDVDARRYCACPATGQEVVCNTMCTSAEFPIMYVEATVTRQISLLFPYPGLGSSHQISSTSTLRVR